MHTCAICIFLFRKEHSICVSRPASGWKVGQDMSGQAPFLGRDELELHVKFTSNKRNIYWTCIRLEGWAGAYGQLV